MSSIIYTKNKCYMPIEVEKHETVIVIAWEELKTNLSDFKIKKYYSIRKKIKKTILIKNAVKDLLDIKDKYRIVANPAGKH